MASAGKTDSLGQAVGAVLGALADPQTLRDLYLAEVQTRANGTDFKAGAGDAAKPALEFMADLSTLGSAVDPNTGQLTPYYQTPEGQAAYKAAQDRMAARAKAVGGAATAAGSAVLKFVADVTPPGAGDPFYVPTQAELETYQARSSAAVGSAVEGAKAMLSATAKPVVDFVETCVLGGNNSSRACGNAAAVVVADTAVSLATDGIGKAASAEIKASEGLAGKLGSAAGDSIPPVRVFNDVDLDHRLPPPKAGYDYVPQTLDSPNPNVANSQVNGFKAELELANTIAALPNQQVISYGAKIGAQGADVISVDVTTGKVTLWDSKWRSNPGNIDSSPTFKAGSSALNKAIKDAQSEIDASNLPQSVKDLAL